MYKIIDLQFVYRFTMIDLQTSKKGYLYNFFQSIYVDILSQIDIKIVKCEKGFFA